MESANIHQHQQHHQLQDQHLLGSSSALIIPSCYASAASTHAWTPNTILNGNSFNACSNGETLSSRDHSWQQNNMLLSSMDGSSMTQELGFNWANTITAQPSYDLHLLRLKNESSDSSSSKVNEKLLLRNFPSGYLMNGFQLSSEDSNSSLSSSGSVTNKGSCFNQIFPTLNDLNSFNHMSLANPSTLDMNLQALDLFNSTRLNEGFGQISRDQHGFFKDGFSYGGLDHMQQPSIIRPYSTPSNISSFSNGVAEAKRSSMMLEPKVPQPPPKKSRIEPRTTCPPFTNVMKVRKEKLGDRIAALQQLVAPFGKTDTASVLMEAIGYIKFLQNQVETLSVPYMKASRNKARVMHGSSTTGNENEESKRDLRNRGLCLVPVSCLSYVTDGGGGCWPGPPPNFGGSV